MAAAALTASLGLVLAASVVTDLRRRLILDAVLAPAAGAAIALTAFAEPGLLAERLAAACGAGGFLLAAAIAKPGGMGLGDFKLAAVMGLHLGAAVVPALALGLASGALGGTVAAAVRGRPLSGATVPLAPHLAAGAAMAGGMTLL
ncbi:hypothetical protein BH20ACT15_BH20ACT15_03730 [soil metagenome]